MTEASRSDGPATTPRRPPALADLESALGDGAGGSQLLVRALRLLFYLRDRGRPVASSELVDVLATPKSNVYRLIQTLELAGLVSRSGRGRVELGLRFLDIAEALHARIDREIAPVAEPVMRALTEQVGESSLLTMPTGLYAIGVLSVDSPQPIRLSYATGRVVPIYAGASGKVLLPWLSSALLDAALREVKQWRGPGGARVTPAQLRREIEAIRAHGYCVTKGEVDAGATGVAAPIVLTPRQLLGGLTVAGPSARFTDDRLPGLIDAVRRAADTIARRHRQGAQS